MSYDSDQFWEAYQKYVDESMPRHRRVVDMLLIDNLFPDVLLDLGCGRTHEAQHLLYPEKCLGVDLENGPLKLNYRDLDHFTAAIHSSGLKPTAFSSLFSVEVTGDWFSNYNLYNRMFAEFPEIKWGLVAGFYYTDEERLGKLIVQEAGGLESYQSTAPIEASLDFPLFEETRVLVNAPSNLFGPHVVEVWKLLERK